VETRKALIYRNELLPLSETFVLSQASALRRFEPLFAGLRRVRDGLDLARHSVLTLGESESWRGKAKRRVFLRTGRTRRFVRAIEAQRPQFIHAHFAIDACAVLPIAKKLRLPLMVTLHGYDVSCSETTLRLWPTTRAYLQRREELWEYADAFFCVSESVRRRALARGFPDGKLLVHRIGIKLRDCSKQEQCRDEKIILFVGRLVEKKGCIHLIHAMSRVQKAITGARLVIVGDGALRKVLEREAASCRNNAVFLGYQSLDDVRQWMRRARILVAPSTQASNGDSEGLPTVLCEAQAEGLPVITFATEGVTEALPVERRASMPQEGDVGALADEIIRLMKEDCAWHHASEAGRRYMETNFDLDVQTSLLEDKYEEMIARRRA
jgi:glycosyltransferase involved in cell wall biosynthesis